MNTILVFRNEKRVLMITNAHHVDQCRYTWINKSPWRCINKICIYSVTRYLPFDFLCQIYLAWLISNMSWNTIHFNKIVPSEKRVKKENCFKYNGVVYAYGCNKCFTHRFFFAFFRNRVDINKQFNFIIQLKKRSPKSKVGHILTNEI